MTEAKRAQQTEAIFNILKIHQEKLERLEKHSHNLRFGVPVLTTLVGLLLLAVVIIGIRIS